MNHRGFEIFDKPGPGLVSVVKPGEFTEDGGTVYLLSQGGLGDYTKFDCDPDAYVRGYFEDVEAAKAAIDRHLDGEAGPENKPGTVTVTVQTTPEPYQDLVFLDGDGKAYLKLDGEFRPIGSGDAPASSLRRAPKGTVVTIEVF